MTDATTSCRRDGEDRRGTRRFVFLDRRSGFERRETQRPTGVGVALNASLLYLRDHPPALLALLATANLLSAVDLILTASLLQLGAAEANPFMRFFFEAGTTQAALVKGGIIASVTLALWALRRRRAALLAALLFLVVYAAVVLYEIAGLTRLMQL